VQAPKRLLGPVRSKLTDMGRTITINASTEINLFNRYHPGSKYSDGRLPEKRKTVSPSIMKLTHWDNLVGRIVRLNEIHSFRSFLALSVSSRGQEPL
jgi:hypothetical protein